MHYIMKVPNQNNYIQRYAKIYQWRIPNIMINMECKITNQNQLMNIVTLRHFNQVTYPNMGRNKQSNATNA